MEEELLEIFFSKAMPWPEMSEKQFLIWGGIFGTTLEGFIEVKDAYSPNWGKGDMKYI